MVAFRTTNTRLSDWILDLFQAIMRWFSRVPHRAKWLVLSEKTLATNPETSVKSHAPFCRGSLKTGKMFLSKALWTMANSEPPCSQPSETFAIRETFLQMLN